MVVENEQLATVGKFTIGGMAWSAWGFVTKRLKGEETRFDRRYAGTTIAESFGLGLVVALLQGALAGAALGATGGELSEAALSNQLLVLIPFIDKGINAALGLSAGEDEVVGTSPSLDRGDGS